MFRLTFILLAVIGIAMLVAGDGDDARLAAVQPRNSDPALLASRPLASPTPRVSDVDYGRPASVDRLLGVEPRPAVQRSAEAPVVAASLEVDAGGNSEIAALDDVTDQPQRRREFLSVNDEIAARAFVRGERSAAADAAEDSDSEAVREEIETALADATIAMVTGTRVNVRSGPSTDYGVVGQVAFGEAAEVLSDSQGGWVHIRIQGDGIEGYVAARFLDGSGISQ